MTYWQDFSDGQRRRKDLVSKVTLFLESRLAHAEEWDIAYLRLTFSEISLGGQFTSYHTVQCWHTPSKCGCLDAPPTHALFFSIYKYHLSYSRLAQSVITSLVVYRDPAQDCLDVLLILLCQRATEVSHFIRMYVVRMFSSPTRY